MTASWRIEAWVGQLKLGNPFDASTTLGPMANKRFCRDRAAPTAEAIAAGAKALIDPARQPADDGGAYLARRSW